MATINIRLSDELKDAASAACEALGTTLSDLLRPTLQYVVEHRQIPFVPISPRDGKDDCDKIEPNNELNLFSYFSERDISMTKDERDLLIFLATFVKNQREYAIREHYGELVGTAASEVKKIEDLIEKIKT